MSYQRAQKLELEWWINNSYNPHVSWNYYVRFFGMHIKRHYSAVCDVGSGPAPFICGPLVNASLRVVVDPLWPEYRKIEKYHEWQCNIHRWHASLDEVMSCQYDAVFCLNALDHSEDPSQMLMDMIRIIKPRGHLFLFVDVDKPRDRMHPRTIEYNWIIGALRPLTRISMHLEKSWKFPNNVLYYVGKKLTGEL